MASAVPLSFATWNNLINNFAIERAAFSGAEIGMLQSIREIPGFLAFAVVLILLLVREQSLALWSLLLLGIGTAATGFFPTVLGLYLTTVVMSLGFHYYETVQSSLGIALLRDLGPKYGVTPEDVIEPLLSHPMYQQLSCGVFTHTVVPNLNRLGLITERTHDLWRAAGLLPAASSSEYAA